MLYHLHIFFSILWRLPQTILKNFARSDPSFACFDFDIYVGSKGDTTNYASPQTLLILSTTIEHVINQFPQVIGMMAMSEAFRYQERNATMIRLLGHGQPCYEESILKDQSSCISNSGDSKCLLTSILKL